MNLCANLFLWWEEPIGIISCLKNNSCDDSKCCPSCRREQQFVCPPCSLEIPRKPTSNLHSGERRLIGLRGFCQEMFCSSQVIMIPFIVKVILYDLATDDTLADIKLKVWKEETVGHTMMRSSILNLHWPKGTLPTRCRVIFYLVLVQFYLPPVQSTISQSSLNALQHWALQTHWYLYQNLAPKQKCKNYVQ